MLLSAKSSEVFTKLEGYPKVAIANLGINGANPVQTGPFGAQLHREEFVDSGVPVLNVGNVTLRGLDTTYLDLVTPEKAKALARYELEADDLLFARTGATLGKVCLVPKKSAGWLMTGHLFRVRFDQQRCLPSFALIALRDARTIKSQVSEQVQGATRPGFNTTLLSRIKIPLPPLSEQHRIVAYLDSLQAKVDALKALQAETQAELDALLPSVLDKAFKGEL
jgi:type I restriction enzyme S subunit